MKTGEKITKLRNTKGWSKKELADLLDVSEEVVKEWESNNSIPAGDTLEQLASLFGVGTDYLVAAGTSDGDKDLSDDSSNNPYMNYRIERDVARDEMRYGGKNNVLFTVYWLAVIVIYFVVSYFGDTWSWSWLIIAIAAIIFYPITNSQKKS